MHYVKITEPTPAVIFLRQVLIFGLDLAIMIINFAILPKEGGTVKSYAQISLQTPAE